MSYGDGQELRRLDNLTANSWVAARSCGGPEGAYISLSGQAGRR
jgi:hypothetical protein